MLLCARFIKIKSDNVHIYFPSSTTTTKYSTLIFCILNWYYLRNFILSIFLLPLLFKPVFDVCRSMIETCHEEFLISRNFINMQDTPQLAQLHNKTIKIAQNYHRKTMFITLFFVCLNIWSNSFKKYLHLSWNIRLKKDTKIILLML